MPEAAIPYNKFSNQGQIPQNIDLLRLDGYLVDTNYDIVFPFLGNINTKGLTTNQLALKIKDKLIEGGQLNNPNVNVRLINAKVSILGEVNQPGTYNFTEQNITILQALGYANDLTIDGKRDDITVVREVDGVRNVKHINITASDFMNSDFYFVKPNDVIIVNPNEKSVKSAGIIGNIGTVLTIASVTLSAIILLTR